MLIKGEKFGRAAWQDQDSRFRQQLLGLVPDVLEEDKKRELEKELAEKRGQASAGPREDVKIVSIDLQPISPLAGITTLRADITHPATVPLLLSALDPGYDAAAASASASGNSGGGPPPSQASSRRPVDLVLSDGAPDVTGLHDLDIYVQSQLLFAALNLTLCVLRPGGKFVAKIFRGRNVDVLYAQLKVFFARVVVAKPRSSRASSVEAFVVCLGFRPPPGFRASLEEPLGVGRRLDGLVRARELQRPVLAETLMQSPERATWDVDSAAGPRSATSLPPQGVTEIEAYDDVDDDGVDVDGSGDGIRWIAPFIACGDLSAFDSDASYQLPEDYVSLDPVQPPIAPPYKRALETRAAQSQKCKS